jgi:chromosome segregation ATPase
MSENIITALIAAIVGVVGGLLASFPAWRASGSQIDESKARRAKIENEITLHVLEQADIHMKTQQAEHDEEIADLTTKYNVILEDNARMANEWEEIKKENEALRIENLEYQRKCNIYERQIEDLRKKVIELAERVGTDPFDKKSKGE